LLNKALLGCLLNSCLKINGHNWVQGFGLISMTALVGAEPGTVAGAAYFTDVQEVVRKMSAVGVIKCMTGLSWSLVAWLWYQQSGLLVEAQ